MRLTGIAFRLLFFFSFILFFASCESSYKNRTIQSQEDLSRLINQQYFTPEESDFLLGLSKNNFHLIQNKSYSEAKTLYQYGLAHKNLFQEYFEDINIKITLDSPISGGRVLNRKSELVISNNSSKKIIAIRADAKFYDIYGAQIGAGYIDEEIVIQPRSEAKIQFRYRGSSNSFDWDKLASSANISSEFKILSIVIDDKVIHSRDVFLANYLGSNTYF